MCSASTDGAALAAELDQRRGERAAARVGLERVRERAVQLDQLGVQLEDVAQAGEAGARVVHGQPRAQLAHAADRDPEARVVLHARVLGHLEHHVVHVRRASSASRSGRSAVAGETFTAMKLAAGSARERSQATPHRPQLQLGAEPDLVRLGEPLRPGRASGGVAKRDSAS